VKSIPTGLTCPECGGELVVRWGKNGEFVGCAAYPKCGFTGDFSRDARGRISLAGLEPAAASAPGEAPGPAPAVRGKPVATGLTCPKCGKELLLRRGRLGEFLGCSGYPKCKFTQNFTRDAQGQVVPQDPEADAAYACPREGCGGHLTKRRSRRGIFYGCSNYPKCAFTMNQPPQERACPQCQHPWLMKKGKKILCPRDECSFEATAPAVGE
jgi:DNA topoisomerase I